MNECTEYRIAKQATVTATRTRNLAREFGLVVHACMWAGRLISPGTTKPVRPCMANLRRPRGRTHECVSVMCVFLGVFVLFMVC